MDENKKLKFAVFWRWISGAASLYTKPRFKGNRYTKLANINDKTLSTEHVDNFVSASYKKIKWSASDVGRPTNISNNSPATAVATDTEMSETTTTGNTFMSESSFLIIDTSILKDIINCVGICPSCANMILSIDQTKQKGLSLLVMLLRTTCNWTTKYYTSRKVKSNSKVT